MVMSSLLTKVGNLNKKMSILLTFKVLARNLIQNFINCQIKSKTLVTE
jgi:hypothetical protein